MCGSAAAAAAASCNSSASSTRAGSANLVVSEPRTEYICGAESLRCFLSPRLAAAHAASVDSGGLYSTMCRFHFDSPSVCVRSASARSPVKARESDVCIYAMCACPDQSSRCDVPCDRGTYPIPAGSPGRPQPRSEREAHAVERHGVYIHTDQGTRTRRRYWIDTSHLLLVCVCECVSFSFCVKRKG